MTDTTFHAIRRRAAAGTFVDGHLAIVEGPPADISWFPCGVYPIGDHTIIVVNEPATLLQHRAIQAAATPTWATALIAATMLTPEGPHPPRIAIDVLHPVTFDHRAAAFAAACAAYDDSFHDTNPVDALLRIGPDIQHAHARYDSATGTWGGVVVDATRGDRTHLARWRHDRSVTTSPGWGGWDATGFHLSTASPYDVAGMVPFKIVSLDGLEIAVVTEPLTSDRTGELHRTPLPSWIDVIATSQLLTPDTVPQAVITVDLLKPSTTDPTRVGVAVAVVFDLAGRFGAAHTGSTVVVADHEVHVRLQPDTDGAGHTWTAHAAPGNVP